MSRQRKRQFRFATFVIVPVILALAALLPALLIAGDDASAINASERETIRQAIDGYVATMYQYGDDGEANFLITSDALVPRLNNDGDASTATGNFLDEGDDAATAPVLVDVLFGKTTMIPGTSIRVKSTNFADTVAPNDFALKLAAKVQQHRDAGFSTDLVVYCLTGHAQDTAQMGYGAMSAAGYFDDPATPAFEAPVVRGLKWGRQGWNYSMPDPTNPIVEPAYPVGGEHTLGAPGSATGSAPADSTTTCSGLTGAELVRCTAQVSNTSSQLEANAPPASFVGVDLRPSPPAGGYLGSGQSVNKPLQTLFASGGGLSELPGSGTTLWFYNRTQHTACMASMGATMMGYPSACLRWGLPAWSSSAPAEKLGDGNPWASQDPAAPDYYPYETPGGSGAGPDNTAPTFTSGPTVNVVDENTADISRTTSEPATTKVRYKVQGTSDWTAWANTTILNASKTVTFTNLTASTNYDWELIAYDKNANPSTTATGSFATPAPADNIAPTVTSITPSTDITTDSATVVAYYSDNEGGSGINTASVSVNVTGAAASACVPSATYVNCSVTGLTVGQHDINVSVDDNSGNHGTGSGSFNVIDNQPPSVNFTGPTATVTSTSTNITADYSDPSPSSGINTLSSATVSLNGDEPTHCTAAGGQMTCPRSGLTTGTYNVTVSISDMGGLTGSDNGVVMVNTDAPTITGHSPATDSWNGDNTPDLSVDFTAPSQVTSASFDVYSAPVSCSSVGISQSQVNGVWEGTATCTSPQLTDGTHEVHATVWAGTNPASDVWPIKIDATPPMTTHDLADPDAWRNTDFIVGLLGTDNIGGIGGVVTQYRVDFGTSGDSWHTGNLININTQGDHVIDFYSTDGLGNAEAPFSIHAKLDKTQPEVALVGPSGYINSWNYSLHATLTDALSGVDISSVVTTQNGDPVGGEWSYIGNDYYETGVLAADGPYNLQVSVSDNAGNTQYATGSFIADTTGPVVTNITPATSTTDKTPDIKVDLSDQGGIGVDGASIAVYMQYGEYPEYELACNLTVTGNGVVCPGVTTPDDNPLEEGTYNLRIEGQDLFNQALQSEGSESSFDVVSGLTYALTLYDYGNGGTGLVSLGNVEGTNTAASNNVWYSGPGWEMGRSKATAAGDDGNMFVLYDYGNGTSGLFLFEPDPDNPGQYMEHRVWISGANEFEWDRSKMTAADYDGDGVTEAVVFYDYGNGVTGMWLFDADFNYSPAGMWFSDSGEWDASRMKMTSMFVEGTNFIIAFYDYGNATTGVWVFHPLMGEGQPGLWQFRDGWDWSRTMINATDSDGDSMDELNALYNYGNGVTGLWLFDPMQDYPDLAWFSGQGWDWNRSKMTSGDIDGDGTSELGVLYNYGSSTTGLFLFGSDSEYKPENVWISSQGGFDWYCSLM